MVKRMTVMLALVGLCLLILAAIKAAPTASHTLSGQVLDPEDKPVENARITILRGSERPLYGYSSPDGKYSISFPEGRPIDAVEYELTGWDPASISGLSGARDHNVHKTLYPSGTTLGPDAVKVEPQHYKVQFENDQIRVLRLRLGANEKLAVHGHPASVLFPLTDSLLRETTPDGKAQDLELKAGQIVWHPAFAHTTQNLSDKPVESIVVELKARQPTAEPAVLRLEPKKPKR